MISRVGFFWSCCVVATSVALTGGAHAESLDSAVRSALEHHPASEAASIAVDVSRKERSAEHSGFFPELSTGATWGRVYQDNSTSRGLSVTRGAAYSYFGEGTVSLRQPLFGLYRTLNLYDAADARVKSSLNTAIDTKENLAFRAVQSYIDVLRTRNALALLRGHYKKVAEYSNRINSMVDEGAADEAELQQAKEIIVVLEGIISDYESQHRSAEANYAEVTGHMPEAEMSMPTMRYDFIPEGSGEAIQYAVLNHPAVKAAENESVAADRDVDAEVSSLIPDLDGELSYLKNDKDDIVGGEAEDARAVLKLNWNLSTGGAQLARIKQKKYQHQETLARVRETQREIERGVRLSYSEFKAAQDQLEHIAKRVTLNEDLFETYEAQFEGALISQLQLMRADNQLLNTKLEKMNAEHRFQAAGYAILASMGRLQETMILASASATHDEN